MYNCPICNSPFELGTKFCTNCGCNLEETFILNPVCPICNKKYPPGSLFCTADGAKLVSPEKLIPKCVICGTQYTSDVKFCPKDGGAVIPEALRYAAKSNSKLNKNNYLGKASFGRRLVASILDGLICAVLSVPSILLYSAGLQKMKHGYWDTTDNTSTAVFLFILAITFYFIPLVYSFIKDGLGEGQSWGKKAMKIKVINVSDNSKCTKGTSALRALVSWLLSLIPIVALIEPIMVLVKSDGRRLADMAADTMVVNV